MSNTKQMANAIAMFTQDHDEYLPKAYYNDEAMPGASWGMDYRTGWDMAIFPYVKSTQVFRCPSDSIDRTYQVIPEVNSSQPVMPTSYRYNISNQPSGPWTALNLAQLDQPADAIVIAESTPGVENANYNQLATWENEDKGYVCIDWTNNTAYDRHISKVPGRGPKTWEAHASEPLDRSARNRGMSNYVFADGHAKSMNWGATWKRIGPDVQTANGAKTVTPTMWRQNFRGTGDASVTDRCGYQEGQNR